MINVGDKYVCKKEFGDLKRCKIYSVSEVKYSDQYSDDMVYFYIDNLHYWFLINDTEHMYYLNNYMFNLKDERKKKLKILNYG